jgi:hypothetical protein
MNAELEEIQDDIKLLIAGKNWREKTQEPSDRMPGVLVETWTEQLLNKTEVFLLHQPVLALLVPSP